MVDTYRYRDAGRGCAVQTAVMGLTESFGEEQCSDFGSSTGGKKLTTELRVGRGYEHSACQSNFSGKQNLLLKKKDAEETSSQLCRPCNSQD